MKIEIDKVTYNKIYDSSRDKIFIQHTTYEQSIIFHQGNL